MTPWLLEDTEWSAVVSVLDSYFLREGRGQLRIGCDLAKPRRALVGGRGGAGEDFPGLAAGFFHEWFREEEKGARQAWLPPLTLLTLLAVEAKGQRRIVWIGRRCWPTFQILNSQSPSDPSNAILRRSVFLDPLTDAERFFSITQALRCPGVACVVADGSGMNVMTSRRLQLAAETGAVLGLLARPAWEIDEPSYAASRWRVRPHDSAARTPQWEIELHSCRGQPAQDAPRQWIATWNYQVLHGTGAVHFSADVGRGLTPAAVSAG